MTSLPRSIPYRYLSTSAPRHDFGRDGNGEPDEDSGGPSVVTMDGSGCSISAAEIEQPVLRAFLGGSS